MNELVTLRQAINAIALTYGLKKVTIRYNPRLKAYMIQILGTNTVPGQALDEMLDLLNGYGFRTSVKFMRGILGSMIVITAVKKHG
jgi:hypothetical protein